MIEVFKKQGIDIEKIILFGSRARGDCRSGSDWDILIITKENIKRDKYLEVYGNIIKRLRLLNIKVDMVIIDKEYFRKTKNVINTISYEALQEGITI
ncbi:MAG: nucleotidyltransferase domain-containing protein [Thermoprotei archaeon]|nr:MAG: nucleotidyltransferase domain-containing protein [Thermoprotei archaeon]